MKYTAWDVLFHRFKWYRKRKKAFWICEHGAWVWFKKSDKDFETIDFESFKFSCKIIHKKVEDYT